MKRAVACGMLVMLVMCAGCRPRLLALLDAPSTTAEDVLEDIRQAHSGGRRMLAMQFMSEETFHPGVGAIFYPELSPEFVARSHYDFVTGSAWQRAARDHGSLLWAWDGKTLRTEKNGRPYTPKLGTERSVHLRTLLDLLRPWDVASDGNVDVRLLPAQGRHPRLRLVRRDDPDSLFIVEADPSTSLVSAVEYTVPGLRAPPIRMEVSDYRRVDDVMIPHLITEHVVTLTGTGAHVHTMALWDVSVRLESAFPRPLGPR